MDNKTFNESKANYFISKTNCFTTNETNFSYDMSLKNMIKTIKLMRFLVSNRKAIIYASICLLNQMKNLLTIEKFN